MRGIWRKRLASMILAAGIVSAVAVPVVTAATSPAGSLAGTNWDSGLAVRV